MKSRLFLFAAALAGTAVGCQPEPEALPETKLTVVDEQVVATADAGSYSFAYALANPTETGRLTATSQADWIGGLDTSVENTVSFTVSLNEQEQRSAHIFLTYSDPAGVQLKDSIQVIQSASEADIHFHAKSVLGGFLTERDHYYGIYLSENGVQEGGYFYPQQNYYRLDFHADADPEDYTAIAVPEGEYAFSDMEVAQWFRWNADLTEYEDAGTFTDGTLTVTREGEEWHYVALLTDDRGQVHRVDYTGPCSLELYNQDGIALITEDVKLINPFLSAASYMDSTDETMRLHMQISSVEEATTMIYLDMYAPYDQYELIPGTYSIGTSQANYTLYPGWVDPDTLTPFGTHVIHMTDTETILALAASGNITIEKDETTDEYTVVIDLKTAEGFSITGTYTGPIVIPNIPGSGFSTLTGDYTVDLSEATSFGTFWGDEFGNGGGYYKLELTGLFEQDPNTYLKQGKGEAVYFEFITNSLDFESGIPSATYTVGSQTPEPGEYIPGYQNSTGQGILSGTYYVGAWEGGYISHCAPAVSGDLNITNHGDGTYDISFSFLDDLGHTWDGEWSGKLSIYNFSRVAPQQGEEHTLNRLSHFQDTRKTFENLNLKQFPRM